MLARKSQISVLALAAACAWAIPAHAEDADTAAIQQQLADMQAQMAAMAAKMDALQGQLNDAKAQAAAAEAKAGDATQVAQAATASAEEAKSTGELAGALAKAAAWAADTKISGRMYYNISHVSADDALGNKVENDGGFEIKRFYLGVDHKFDDTFSGNVTMDISKVDNGGKNVGYGFYVKKAYLEAKLAKELKLRLGATDMPWIPYVEGVYGYRHVEKTLTDLDGFGTSSDWGVHASGSLADGIVSYAVSAVDGGGYRDPKFTKTVDLEGRISVKYQGFNAAIGGYTGKLGKDVHRRCALPHRLALQRPAGLQGQGRRHARHDRRRIFHRQELEGPAGFAGRQGGRLLAVRLGHADRPVERVRPLRPHQAVQGHRAADEGRYSRCSACSTARRRSSTLRSSTSMTMRTVA